VTIESPAALQFIMDEDLYLLKGDKRAATSVLAEPIKPPSNAGIEDIILPVQQPAVAVPSAIDFRYLGGNKKNFLILVHYPDTEFIDDGHLTALVNILKRKELYLDDVAIVNTALRQAVTLDEATRYFKPQKILMMGKNALPADIEAPVLNRPKKLDNCVLLYSFSFDEMMDNTENKKVFWEQVKIL
jgi:hypothetical protein